MTKQRSNIIWEFLRKAVHLSGLVIIVLYTWLINFFSEQVAILVLTGILLLFLEIEYLRLVHGAKIRKITNVLDPLIREHEKDQLLGSVYFIISCIICFAAFDYWIAVLAMFMTVFGDLFSALLGKCCGKIKLYKNKTMIGTGSGLLANLAVALLILPEFLIIAVPMAVIATFVELITSKLDDNLTVPLFAGFAGQLLVWYFDVLLPPLDFSILGFF